MTPRHPNTITQAHTLIAYNHLNGRSVALYRNEDASAYYLVTSSIWWDEEPRVVEHLTQDEAREYYTAGDLASQVPEHVAFPPAPEVWPLAIRQLENVP